MAMAQLELKLVRTMGGNKKVLKYIYVKRQCRNCINPSQDEDGNLTVRDIDKADVFNAFFVFNIIPGLWGSQHAKQEDHGCDSDKLPVDPELWWDLLLQLDPCKSMGPDGIHLRILKELVDTQRAG